MVKKSRHIHTILKNTFMLWRLKLRRFVLLILVQGKANPAQASTGPEDSQTARQSAHEGGKVVSPKFRTPLTPRRYPRYSFLLEGECGRKDYVNEKFQWHHRESNTRRPASTNCATACPLPIIKTSTEWDYTDRGRPKYSDRSLFQCYLFTIHLPWTGIEPGSPR